MTMRLGRVCFLALFLLTQVGCGGSPKLYRPTKEVAADALFYTAGGDHGELHAYALAADGSWTERTTRPVRLGAYVERMVVSSDGRWLYALLFDTTSHECFIASFAIDAAGIPSATPVSRISTCGLISLNPAGNVLLVSTNDTVVTVSVEDGHLTPAASEQILFPIPEDACCSYADWYWVRGFTPEGDAVLEYGAGSRDNVFVSARLYSLIAGGVLSLRAGYDHADSDFAPAEYSVRTGGGFIFLRDYKNFGEPYGDTVLQVLHVSDQGIERLADCNPTQLLACGGRGAWEASPSGRLLAIYDSVAGKLRVVSVDQGTGAISEAAALPLEVRFDGDFTPLFFSPSERILVAADEPTGVSHLFPLSGTPQKIPGNGPISAAAIARPSR
jgi:hypothetical protein